MSEADWRQEIAGAFERRGSVPDADVVEELAEHALASYEASLADGDDPAAARRRVLDEINQWATVPGRLGPRLKGPLVVSPPVAGRRGIGWWQDLRYAWRLMSRRPGSSAMTTLTIALGITAASTLFSLTYAVLQRPLPWPNADRLVSVWETREGGSRSSRILTNLTYHAWLDQAETIEDLAAYTAPEFTLTTATGVERVLGVQATPNLFRLLGVAPSAGRLFHEEDEGVAVVSDRFAARVFGTGNPLGQAIQLAGKPVTVVGVLPEARAFPSQHVEVWVPYRVSQVNPGALSMFTALARIKPGVTVEQVAAEGTARGRTVPDPGLVTVAVFGSDGPLHVTAVPWLEMVTEDVRPALLVLLGGVGFLIVTAAASLAGLQLARASGRRREFAIRAAIGAGQRQIARQLLAETLLLSAVGGLAALILTAWLHQLVPAVMPQDFPRLDAFTFGNEPLVFAVVLTLAMAFAVALLPAWYTSRLNIVEALVEDSLAPVGIDERSSVGRMRGVLIVGQVAVAVALLIGAGLFGRSFLVMVREDLGYQPGQVLSARVIESMRGRATPATMEAFAERLKGLPEVAGVALSTALPFQGARGESMFGFTMPARDGAGTTEVQARVRAVTPSYYGVLGMRLVQGRYPTEAEAHRSDWVLVVNQTFARAFLGDRPLGPLQMGDRTRQVIGVVEDVRERGMNTPVDPQIFVPYGDGAGGFALAPVLFVRAGQRVLDLAPMARRILKDVDPTLGLDDVQTMDDRLSTMVARPRVYTIVVGVLAAFALLIAVVGLFGVISYTVTQRTREIGVRSALGATQAGILRLVVGQGVRLAAVGTGLGIATAAVLARFLSGLLYGVMPWDPVTYGLVPILVLGGACLACIVPARRAARLDPLAALRHG